MSGGKRGLVTAVVALSAALLGSVVGGLFAYRAAIDAQAIQAEELRADDERVIRRETYLVYLDNALAYRYSTSRLLGDIEQAPDADVGGTLAAFDPWVAARADYRRAVNSLYVYGSDESWQRHQAIAATLPYAVGYVDQVQIVEESVTFGDTTSFVRAYNDFLHLMCKELPATPRDGC